MRSWKDRAAAAKEWEREHEAEWARVDQRLRGIAARRAALDAEEAQLLRYAEELKLWEAYGFASLVEYMERAMGYAPHTAVERLRVARAIAELPVLAAALEDGELAHSAVRELSRVAVPDTEEVWLEATRGKNLREIEAMVSGHKPGDLPTDATEPRLHRKTLTIEVSPGTYDLWRKMHALAAEEHGQRLSDDELISSVFRRAYGDAGGDGTPAYKIAIKQCPDCKRAWQYTSGRDIEIDPAVAECAACDAVHLGSLDATVPERATMTVTARKREQVLARDGHCCTVPGCRRTIGLDLHHIQFQSRGGGHALSNITIVCDLHHRAIHLGKLVIRGAAPDHLTFEFRKPRDRRNVTDDDVHPSPSPGTLRSTAPPPPTRPELQPPVGPSHVEARPCDHLAAPRTYQRSKLAVACPTRLELNGTTLPARPERQSPAEYSHVEARSVITSQLREPAIETRAPRHSPHYASDRDDIRSSSIQPPRSDPWLVTHEVADLSLSAQAPNRARRAASPDPVTSGDFALRQRAARPRARGTPGVATGARRSFEHRRP